MAMIETASGRRIFYDDHDDGKHRDKPPLLLIVGHAASRRGWDLQVPVFTEHFRVVTMDNRDTGESDPETSPYGITDMAEDAHALLSALNIAKAHVVGRSMGTGIAAALAIAHPDLVDHLILVVGRVFGTGSAVAQPTGASAPREEWVSDPVERTRRNAPASVAPGYFDHHPERLALVMEQERGNRMTYDGMERQRAAIRLAPSVAQIGTITAPTLVINGEKDSIPVAAGEELARSIPGARFLLFEGVGHRPQTERTEEFNRAVLTFLGVAPGH